MTLKHEKKIASSALTPGIVTLAGGVQIKVQPRVTAAYQLMEDDGKPMKTSEGDDIYTIDAGVEISLVK